jgi:hypothetical protein
VKANEHGGSCESSRRIAAPGIRGLYLRVDVLRARRQARSLPAEDSALLRQINSGFSESWWSRYRDLIEKRQNEALTAKQRRELIRLTDAVEKQEAKRLAALVKLARRRQQPLTELMKELGLHAKANA